MKEIIIKNEFDCSYLLIEEDMLVSGYKYEMIVKNKIPGLLECKKRYLEEKTYLAYDITSKKSMEQEYAEKRMCFTNLVELFYGIYKIICQSNEYLLEYTDFILQPQYIFMDLETEELSCLYYPNGSDNLQSKRETYRALADFILDKIDHKDEHAVNIAYHFYKLSKEEFFSFETFVNFMEKEMLLVRAEEKREKKQAGTGESFYKEELYREEKEETEREPIIYTDTKGSPAKWWGMGSLLLVGGVFVGVYCLFPSIKEYALYILVPGLVLIVAAILLLIRCVVLHIKEEDEEYEQVASPVRVEDYFDSTLDDVTVFFDKEEYLCMKWKEGRFSKEYILEEFPITIGKLKDSVQMEIKDTSISRLHARLRKQNNCIYLQDLDSTNGTFVNGRRLLTGEDAIIKRGDEIQFGKITVNVV